MNTQAETPTQAPSRNNGTGGKSTLAADIKIVGDVSSEGSIDVMGEIEGTITAQGLMIGAEGRMNGTVSAESVEVRGKMEGRISCSSLTLRSSAQVTADATYRMLVIESGAQIDGRFKHARE